MALDRVVLMRLPARAALARERWLLLALAALVCSSGLGLRDPMPPDEPRFALVARDMAATGEWLIPRRNGELYPDKPPLFMWLIALATRVTGSPRIGFLVPSLAAALAAFALVHDLAARLWGRRPAAAAALALLVSGQFAWQARWAQIDMLLVGWTTAGLYGVIRHLLLGPAWGWWWFAGVAMGLGVISKGVGFLPLLALAPWAVARWRALPGAPGIRGGWWRWALGPALLFAVIAAWLVPMALRVSASGDPALAAYRDDILFTQTAKRYADPDHHFKPAWFYLANAPLMWLPLTLLLPWVAPAWARRLRRGDARLWLLLGWAALVVVFFSISRGKRGVYVFPALPAVVLAAAPLLPGLFAAARGARLAKLVRGRAAALRAAWRPGARLTALRRLPALLDARLPLPRLALGLTNALGIVALSAAVVCARLALPAPTLELLAQQRLDARDFALGLTVIGILALAAACAWRRRGGVALVAAGCLGWMAFGWIMYPTLAGRSPTAFMREIDAIAGATEVGMVNWREQYVLSSPRPIATFGYAGKVSFADEDRAARAWLAGGDRRLLVPVHRLGAYADLPAAAVGFQNGTPWWLVAPAGP